MKKILCLLLMLSLLSGCLGEEPEQVDDAALPSVMVDGQLYWLMFNSKYAVEAPAEEFWVGTVTSLVPYNRVPSENDQTNVEACLNQPYAFVDGVFMIYAENVPFYSVEGNVASFAGYYCDSWFKCEIADWMQ